MIDFKSGRTLNCIDSGYLSHRLTLEMGFVLTSLSRLLAASGGGMFSKILLLSQARPKPKE